MAPARDRRQVAGSRSVMWWLTESRSVKFTLPLVVNVW